jgi:hypothetical protein
MFIKHELNPPNFPEHFLIKKPAKIPNLKLYSSKEKAERAVQ